MAESEEKLKNQIEGYAESIVKVINYDRLKLWKEVLFHPTEIFSNEIKNASLMRGAKDIFIASIPLLLISIVSIILYMIYLSMYGTLIGIAKAELGFSIISKIIIIGVLVIIGNILAPIINWLINSAGQYVIAKIFGGKIDFKTHAYLVALAVASTTAATAVFLLMYIVASFIPCIGWLFVLLLAGIMTFIWIYGFYLQYKAIRIAHDFDLIKALITVLLPNFLVIVLYIVFIATIYVSFWTVTFSPVLSLGQ